MNIGRLTPVACGLFVLFQAAAAAGTGWNVATGGDPARGGYLDVTGPDEAILLWQGGAASVISWQPVVDGSTAVAARCQDISDVLHGTLIYAYDIHDGTELWSADLPVDFPSTDWRNHVSGMFGGTVYASRAGNTNSSYIYALNGADGTVIWRSQDLVDESSTEGIAFSPGGDPVVGCYSSVMRIDSEDGTTVWQTPRNSHTSGGSEVAVDDGKVYGWTAGASGPTISVFDLETGDFLYQSPPLGGGFIQQLAPFAGHDGRAGFDLGPEFRVRVDEEGPHLEAGPTDPGKRLAHGHGIGGNYWDLLPFGHKDAYATMLAYPALLAMADLEEAVRGHPGWHIPACPDPACSPDRLRETAEALRAEAQRIFWNPETRRFAACVDGDGCLHDYGFTFLNLEMIHYGVASHDQAVDILDWIAGDRVVEGDTSTGPDIYHWRFAPRSTTRRNVEWYGWYWNGPETIPWGGQVQDGGAVLGFSYHDLMARLRVHGPDDAWERLAEVADWYGEVVAGGGYRAYYADGRDGATLQGGGTAGGLGLDHEFYESILVPQVLLYGFLGYRPGHEGFSIDPRLPASWPGL